MMTEAEGSFDFPVPGSVDSPITPMSVESCAATENDQLMSGKSIKQMALYEDDEEERPLVSRVIFRLANYEGGMVPNVEQETADEAEMVDEEGGSKKRKKKIKKTSKKKLGTVLGVYFPCIQNIFGVILFIRLVWVVGTAGWVETFVIAFMCCCCTMTTSISMSAIATNGVVPGGGSYFMISRSLGPEFGGAVGILFYLGTTVASSMYIVGAVEILLQYMAPPEAAIFGDIDIPTNAYNCYRVYGTCLLLVMFTCVFIGVKFVSKFSPIALFCVIFSIVCVYIGIFVANPDRGPKICFLGERLLSLKKIKDANGTMQCNKAPDGPVYKMYCPNITDLFEVSVTDLDCIYFRDHETWLKPGIPGLQSGNFFANAWKSYSEDGNRLGSDEKGDREKGDIIVDISTSFVVLIGIFFPSVTGIMAGSNRSGDLADAQKSIPVGTISAIATTSFVYLSCLLLFGACVEGQFLRDKIGESMGGGLIVAQMAWPSPWVIMIGSFLSTCGAGLQSLVGAPRLLQAIAADGVIPFLNAFAVTNKNGEPRRALFLTAAIAESGVLLANVDYIAPIITMFFLMCYCFTNLACAVQTILKTPNWRPRFRLYHWALSLFGVSLCLCLMFMASWYYAIAALCLAAGIYKYIEYKGAEKEWGDGIRGLAMSAARFALLRLEEGPPHVKNWRPQLLILLKAGENLEPKYRKLLTFSSQLKAGKGLTLIAAVLEGEHHERKSDADVVKQNMIELMKRERVKGFAEVIIARNVGDGVSYLIQGAGVGGLRHNSLLMNWPHKWRSDNKGYQSFIDMMRIAGDRQLAVMIVKGINQFPENGDRLGGTIDVWWIVHEGGLLMLLPFLLTQGKVWRKCKMRIFTVAQMEDNSIQIKKDMEKFLYHLRIPAQVKVVEMPSNDISAYTYERTLMMEQRNELLEKMHIKRTSLTPQMIVDQAHPHHIYHVSPRHQQPSPQQQQPQQQQQPEVQPKQPQETPKTHSGNVNINMERSPEKHAIKEEGEREEGEVERDPEEPGKEGNGEREGGKRQENGDVDGLDEQRVDAEGQDNVDDDDDEDHVRTASTSAAEDVIDTGTNQGYDNKMKEAPSSSSPPPPPFNNPSPCLSSPPPNYNSLNAQQQQPILSQQCNKSDNQSSANTSVPNTQNVRRMHTAIRLNQVIKSESVDSKLVILNLPGPPRDNSGEENYMNFLEALTEGLERVLMVRGGGNEVITIYS